MKLFLDGHWLEDVSGVSTYCRRIFERLPGLLAGDEYQIVTRSAQGLPREHVLPAPSAYRWE